MFKKAVLMVFAMMLLIAGAGIASATQVGGMSSGNGTGLPAGLTVHVNPAGLGDALIYGYYNVKPEAQALTFFRLVNTSTTHAVKARVRFREAKTSAEILDFNVCLSNKDQWSAWILPNSNGGATILPVDGGLLPSAAVIAALPDTITAPPILNAGEGGTGVAFKCGSGAGCSSTAPTLANVTAADTTEGYWEVIGEVAIDHVDTVDGGELTKINFGPDACLANLGRHNGHDLLDVPNSLGGDASVFVLRPTVIGLFSYNATAIADCLLDQDYSVGDESPDWSACANGLPGVDYVLTKQDHIAMYNVEDWSKGQTEVIVNFPTKSKHVLTTSPWSTKPFTFGEDLCQPITINIYNDLQDTTQSTTDFSPGDSSTGAKLCNEVNVIKINSSDILDSDVVKTLDVTPVTPFSGLGWVRIGLNTSGSAATCLPIAVGSGTSSCFPFGVGVTSTHETYGLPSLGFVLTDILDVLGQMNETLYYTNVVTPAP